ncbi:hypothetical protein NBRC111894_1715 [Sporolactobacillus inulinus]|uniref:Uncharacterized protein n=1 Tax=Sporolactobacillus inulinus TaxID=2078 RepID=A0A4Y1ZB76_9BACL|nr:hypothetical protein [Sporolactobacillus inulinus]GAY76161.1 hypothetical protein NBRC111894_1715 [Sporolactobacillus inulinus]
MDTALDEAQEFVEQDPFLIHEIATYSFVEFMPLIMRSIRIITRRKAETIHLRRFSLVHVRMAPMTMYLQVLKKYTRESSCTKNGRFVMVNDF